MAVQEKIETFEEPDFIERLNYRIAQAEECYVLGKKAAFIRVADLVIRMWKSTSLANKKDFKKIDENPTFQDYFTMFWKVYRDLDRHGLLIRMRRTKQVNL